MSNHTTNDPTNEVPHGYCHCGCGQKTNLSPKNCTKYEHIKDEPFRFIRGHQSRRPLEERFWSKVDKRESNECWLWGANKDRHGYGRVSKNRTSKLAHRVAWELENGPIPDGLCCLHQCDVRSCCNPDHLFLGTIQDNVDDMFDKGRENKAKGKRHGQAKLIEEDIPRIRKLYADGMTQVNIGKIYGVSRRAIGSIIHKKHWTHV